MTPLPKRKLSRARQGKRRAAIKLSLPTLIKCPNCKQMVIPHTVCKFCGYYKSTEIVKIKLPNEKSHRS